MSKFIFRHKFLGSIFCLILVMFSWVSINLTHQRKAEAVLTPCTVTTSQANNVYPRLDGMATREDFGCAPSVDTWMWLSSYWNGSPLHTPNAVVRVFFTTNDIALAGGNLGVVNLVTDPFKFVCGAVINVEVTDANGPGQQPSTIQKDAFCGGPVMPTIVVPTASLRTLPTEYGPDWHFFDIVMQMQGAQKNAPIRLVASSPFAQMTFRDQNAYGSPGGVGPYVPFASGNDGFNAANFPAYAQVGPDAGAFALWTGQAGPLQERITYTLNFSPDCSVAPGAPVTIYLRWYDADFGDLATQPSEFGFIVVDDGPPGPPAWVPPADPMQNGAILKGNDAYGELAIPVIGGHKYRWIWSGVSRHNGVQVFMPFSEITTSSQFTCVPPPQSPIGGLAVDCNNWSGWARDDDLPGAAINVHIYLDGPAGVGVFYGAFLANGPQYVAGHGFNVPVPVAYKYTPHTVYAYAIGINSVGTPDGDNPQIGGSPAPYAACPAPRPSVSCSPNVATAVTYVSPTNEPGVVGTLSTTIVNNAVLDGPTITVTNDTYTSAPAGIVPTVNAYPAAIGQGGSGTVSNPTTFSAPNSYLVTSTVTFTAPLLDGTIFTGSVVCQGTILIADLPYMRVYGGDVRTGYNFTDSAGACTPTGFGVTPTINTSASQSIGNNKGGGTEFAAFSVGPISGFHSAALRAAAPISSKGLTFANNLADLWGGNFGSPGCVPNYWTSLQKPPLATTGSVNLNLNAAGQVKHVLNPCAGIANQSGTNCFTLPATVVGAQSTTFVDGDLLVSGPVTYSGGPWLTITAIPTATVVVCGNIYIDKGVANLSGWYIAMPRSYCGGGAVATGGTIYTCTNGFQFVDPVNLFTDCGNTLTVRGSFMANRIKFLRTHGALRTAPLVDDVNSANLAEKFIFGPESWLVSPVQNTLVPNIGGTKFDAITGLPPIL